MRRSISLVTSAAVMTATMVLSGTAFAQDPPTDEGNPSCFGAYARSEPSPPGPGTTFVKSIVTVAAPGGVDELAGFVGELNQNRPCPPPPANFEQP